MNFLDKIWIFIKEKPFLFVPISILIIIYTINKIITDYTMGKVNPIKLVIDYIPIFFIKKKETKTDKYFNILKTTDFLNWETLILSKIYSEHKFPILFNQTFPIVCFPAKVNYKYPFCEIINKDELIFEMDKFKLDSKIQIEYKELIGSKIKRPLLKGYMLNELILDEDQNLIRLTAKVGTYEQNVYTSHILEYELYKLFLNKSKDFTKLSEIEILNYLPLRKSIHKNCNQLEVTSKGLNRSSLLGVQMIVLFLDHDDYKYKALYITRSKDVSAKPEFKQFIPSGGFEIFNSDENEIILRENFSLRLSLFRELLEEAFGEEEFIHNDKGMPLGTILSNEKIRSLTKLIKDNKAQFEFLGSINDLVYLRHLLAFILKIDDIEFSYNTFIKNHEGYNIEYKTLEQIENEFKLVCNDSAGMYYLAKNSKLLKEVLNNDIKFV